MANLTAEELKVLRRGGELDHASSYWWKSGTKLSTRRVYYILRKLHQLGYVEPRPYSSGRCYHWAITDAGRFEITIRARTAPAEERSAPSSSANGGESGEPSAPDDLVARIERRASQLDYVPGTIADADRLLLRQASSAIAELREEIDQLKERYEDLEERYEDLVMQMPGWDE